MDKITVENMNLYYGDFHALKDVNLNMQEKRNPPRLSVPAAAANPPF